MKIWYCTDHDSFYPVGCASVVSAETEDEARLMLIKALKEKGLNPYTDFTLHELPLGAVKILVDGNY